MPDELMDIVDAEDRVIGTAMRSEVYAKQLRHRIVHVLVKNAAGDMALQLRSASMSYCPGYWCTAAGGHVHAGERPEDAAARELREELGITLPLRLLGSLPFVSPSTPPIPKFLSVFETTFDGPFDPDPKEVERVEYFSLPTIIAMVERDSNIHPELAHIVRELLHP